MAQTVIVQTTASGSGAPVAVESLGTFGDIQLIKLLAGNASVTVPIEGTSAAPAAAAVGMVVRQVDGLSVTAAVSGTVSIVPTVLTVNTAATVAGASVTIQQGASVTAAVSGTVSIIPTVLTVNTAPTVAGASITIQQGASVSAVVSGTVSIVPGASITGTVDIGILASVIAYIVSITGTTIVAMKQPQGSTASLASGVFGMNVRVADSAIVAVSNVVPVTTQASVSVTGIPVWFSPSATVQVSGVIAAVTTQSAGTGGLIWLAPTQTVIVQVSGIVPVTTQASVSVTGIPVWWNPSATIQVSGVVAAVTTQSNATGAAIWLCPTQTMTVTVGSSVIVVGRGGMVAATVTSTAVLATSTTQFMLMTVNFDQYTASALVSGYTVRQPFAMTGITVVYSATSVTVQSVVFAVYATTSGVSLTSAGAMIMWSTIFPTMTGAGVSTTLNFPATIVFPANGVIGLACYRVTSATTVANIAFTLAGQYLN